MFIYLFLKLYNMFENVMVTYLNKFDKQLEIITNSNPVLQQPYICLFGIVCPVVFYGRYRYVMCLKKILKV